jgi:catechol 2,3-dioxygenase-like lactoylglutathione lyase family enzyme
VERTLINSNGINHLATATWEVEASIRFRRGLLGMRLVSGLDKSGFWHYFFEISKTDLRG